MKIAVGSGNRFRVRSGKRKVRCQESSQPFRPAELRTALGGRRRRGAGNVAEGCGKADCRDSQGGEAGVSPSFFLFRFAPCVSGQTSRIASIVAPRVAWLSRSQDGAQTILVI